MPIHSRTWYARIGVFQSNKIVTQSNSFQTDSLNLTVQNTAFMYNNMSTIFFYKDTLEQCEARIMFGKKEMVRSLWDSLHVLSDQK